MQNTLLKLLENGDDVDRCNVCRYFANKPIDRMVQQALLGCLNDDDIDVVIDSIKALGSTDELAVEPLIALLQQDESLEIKIACIEALGCLAGRPALDAILALLNQVDTFDEPTEEWSIWWDAQKQIIEAIGKIGLEAGVEPLLEFMNSDDCDFIEEVIYALANCGDKGVLALAEQLKSTTQLRRQRVLLLAIAKSPSLERKAILQNYLFDSELALANIAIAATAQFDGGQYQQKIFEHLLVQPNYIASVIHYLKSHPASSAQLRPVCEKLLLDDNIEAHFAAAKLISTTEVFPDEMIDTLFQHQSNAVVQAVLPYIQRNLKPEYRQRLEYLANHDKLPVELRLEAFTALLNPLFWDEALASNLVSLLSNENDLTALLPQKLTDFSNQYPEVSPAPREMMILLVSGKLINKLENIAIEVEKPEAKTTDNEAVMVNVDNESEMDLAKKSTLDTILAQGKVSHQIELDVVETPAIEIDSELQAIIDRNDQIGTWLMRKEKIDSPNSIRIQLMSYLSQHLANDSPLIITILSKLVLQSAESFSLRRQALQGLLNIAKQAPTQFVDALDFVSMKVAFKTDREARLTLLKLVDILGSERELMLEEGLQDSDPSIQLTALSLLGQDSLADKQNLIYQTVSSENYALSQEAYLVGQQFGLPADKLLQHALKNCRQAPSYLIQYHQQAENTTSTLEKLLHEASSSDQRQPIIQLAMI